MQGNPANIVGRSIALLGPSGQKEAQCVIGVSLINDESTFSDSDRKVFRGACSLQSISSTDINGYFLFSTTRTNNYVFVQWYVSGLTDGRHDFFYSEKGDISSRFLTGEIFAGVSNRPVGQPMSAFIYSVDGRASGSYTDTIDILAASGDGIVGLSVVILGNSTSATAKVAHCVIGNTFDDNSGLIPNTVLKNTTPRIRYRATRANALVYPISSGSVYGSVQVMLAVDTTTKLQFVYYLHGLRGNRQYKLVVTENGDTTSTSGSNLGDLFKGDCLGNCRSGSNWQGSPTRAQAVGYIGGTNQAIESDDDGYASGSIFDSLITFEGINSVLGRGVAVYDAVTNNIVAQGVLGRSEEYNTTSDDFDDLDEIETTIAVIRGLPNNGAVTGAADVQGWFQISTFNDTHVALSWFIQGLEDGVHGAHIHVFGNVLDSNSGSSTAGHFIGISPPDRPSPSLDEVGYIPGGVNSTGGIASGTIYDEFIKLNGNDGVVGRAITLHDPNVPTRRVAQGVIAVQDVANKRVPFVPQPTPAPFPTDDGFSISDQDKVAVGLAVAFMATVLICACSWRYCRKNESGSEREMQKV